MVVTPESLRDGAERVFARGVYLLLNLAAGDPTRPTSKTTFPTMMHIVDVDWPAIRAGFAA